MTVRLKKKIILKKCLQKQKGYEPHNFLVASNRCQPSIEGLKTPVSAEHRVDQGMHWPSALIDSAIAGEVALLAKNSVNDPFIKCDDQSHQPRSANY